MQGFERVLVPVDFSEATDELIDAGRTTEIAEGVHVDLAAASVKSLEMAKTVLADGGELRLIHATPPLNHAPIYSGPAAMGGLTSALEEIHRAAKQASIAALEAIAQKHCPGVKVSFAAQPSVPLDFVLAQAESFEAQLIVIAASGRSGVARFFLGSTADRVIRLATAPVLVVPTGAA